MPPIQSSLACVVVAVVPVVAVVLAFVVALAVTETSDEVGVRSPLYSATTAAARIEFRLIVTADAVAPETFGAYQISVVEPLVLVPWLTLDHVAPAEVMEVTRPALVPRVAIMAISVLPFTGAVENAVVLNVLAVLLPVLPVVNCTLAGVAANAADARLNISMQTVANTAEILPILRVDCEFCRTLSFPLIQLTSSFLTLSIRTVNMVSIIA
jgi:hypothetical protein